MTTSENDTQDTPLHGPNLILDVENFGPIAEAKNIEFKPMTVFVGPSNTGKTYLAMLTHALLRARHEAVPPRSNLNPIREIGLNYIDTDALRNFTLNLGTIVSKIPQASELCSDSSSLWIDVNDLTKDSVEFLGKFVNDNVRLTAARYEIFIQRYFEVDSLVEFSNHSTNGDHRPSVVWSETSGHLRLSPDLNFISCDISDSHFGIGSDLENELRGYAVDQNPGFEREVLKSMADFLVMVLDNLVYSHYIPSGRSGIMNSRHLLASQLTAREDQSYYLLARDFLSALVAIREIRSKSLFPSRRFTSIRRIPGTNLKTEHVASVIEDCVLKGRVQVEEADGLAEFYFVKGRHRVPMTSASSTVTDLAPLVLFVRNFVQLGDLLIIDEPEAHLHPAAQQQMAAALAFMIRSGLRVLITTHSHYMVEQLGNFVAVSTLDEEMRKRVLKLDGALGKEDIYLNESEVAVYDFATDKSEHGSVVETVDFNQDYGYFPRDHNWAIADQMNRTQRVIEARIDQDDPVSAQ